MAGLGRRIFAPGEVLTASNVMNYLQDQSVMNFPSAAARGSAIGTAVSEGMVSYLADTNVLEVYDSSNWRQVFPQAVMPGLIPRSPTAVVNTGGSYSSNALGSVTFTGVTEIALDGVFTSAFRNYKIVFNTNLASGGSSDIFLRLRSGGTDLTAGVYGWGRSQMSTSLSFVGGVADSATSINMASVSAFGNAGSLDIFSPQAASTTQTNIETIQANIRHLAFGYVGNSTQYDGFKIFITSSSMTGQVTCYGYNN
jgi:hypothetical protein